MTKTHALLAARDKLDEPDAAETIRRLAHQLHSASIDFDLPEITAAAASIDAVRGREIEAAVTELIAVLQRLSAGVEVGGRILLVDDDETVASMIRVALAGSDRVLVHASTVAEAQKLMWAQPFDLVILDLILPDGDGRDLIVSMRQRAATADVPVVALSGRYASHVRSECIALGVELFFEKPLDTAYLATTVAELLQRRHSRDYESGYDRITGLRSQVAFHAIFDQVLSFCRRTGISMSLAVLAIDRFDALAAEHGHAVSNDVMAHLAGTIVKSLREEDIAGRWDQNEFIVVLLGARRDDAVYALGRIRNTMLQDGVPIAGQNEPILLSLSGGVTEVATGSYGDDAAVDTLASALGRGRALLAKLLESGNSRIIHAGSAANRSHTQVLIAEDEEGAADVLCRLLEADDYAVTHCVDGASALRAANATAFDMVILERVLPDADGFELIEKLRSDPTYHDTPLVVVTGSDDDETVERAFALGADDVITKPFRMRVLRARLRRHMKRKTRVGTGE
ncbi:MAG: response regulator [Myxococcota bacterium]